MAQRAVPSGEAILAVWAGEDAFRGGRHWLHHRVLPGGGEMCLTRGRRMQSEHLLTLRRLDDDEHVYHYADGNAAWFAALGWDGEGEPAGYSHHRRRP